MKTAALGLTLILLALPFASHADEDLVAKRDICRREARARIVPVGKIAVDEYRRIVERRNAYVRQCMTRALAAPAEAQVPTKKVIESKPDTGPKVSPAPVKRKPQRVLKRSGRRKLKAGSAALRKGKKIVGKRLHNAAGNHRRHG